ncbi:unnamed protein product [Eruca vesicaria subsp. sativa]|uniref:Zinc finger protein n=1 Tax=Eruca vesicaria subsp. sativa TaxID=29727 RepID=A0ABC8LTA3_ERUVS|nr:unnamed protein product [Eruca vesicaria subsp. sativa]
MENPSSTDASRSSVDAIRPDPSPPPPPPPPRTPSSSVSKKECAICLDEMKKGDGKAIFTAECSHSFHFDCITTNVKHGNRICPLCRTHWKQLPLFLDNPIPPPPPPPFPTFPPFLDNPIPFAPPPHPFPTFSVPTFPTTQMGFEDDELLPPQGDTQIQQQHSGPPLEVKLLPQVSSVAKRVTLDDFAVLVHLKAGVVSDDETPSRAPLDLVAVLDVSSSMEGSKMELLKNAVTFVIQNLGDTDRLSVVTFSSTAHRVFPLRLMSETGKQFAIQAVNSLFADGCTNIAEGLKVGARVIADRRCRNPVPVMMLLSDGQDNFTFSHFEGHRHRTDYECLLPSSSTRIPIHTFGFGSDHDAELMHTISQVSSGTFSFIETETVIRDAFAQCIGGLLSTVVLDQVVEIECIHEEGLKISSVKAGSYRNNVSSDGRSATINVGDMYAEEERDFLVVLEIPTCEDETMSLVKVRCVYKDPISREIIRVESGELIIQRPEELTGEEVVSIEVDRQRNRFLVSQAISEAKVLADGGDVRAAAELLRKSERDLSETISARSGDSLCASLTMELKALQEKMASRSRYQTSGRAYALSSMSANLAQRATSRYSPTCTTYSAGPAGYSMPQAYQTSAMARMVTRSQQLGIQSPKTSPAPRDQT